MPGRVPKEDADALVLATGDLGLKIKAMQRGVKTFRPLDSDKLAEEPDPKDKKIADLTSELQQYKTRAPKLAVVFRDGGERTLRLGRPRAGEALETLEQVKMLHPPLGQNRAKSSLMPGLVAYDALWNNVSPAQRDAYNASLEQFFVSYERYYAEYMTWRSLARSRVLVHLVLKNSGTMPATGIDVGFTFPEDILVIDGDEVHSAPKEPTPPEMPTPFSVLKMNSHDSFAALRSWDPSRFVAVESDSSLRFDGNEAHFKLRQLKHTTSYDIDGFWVQAPNVDALRSMSVEVVLSANEMLTVHKQELSLVLESLPR